MRTVNERVPLGRNSETIPARLGNHERSVLLETQKDLQFLEAFLNEGKLLLQIGDFTAERGDFVFEAGQAGGVGVGGTVRGFWGRGGGLLRGFEGIAGKQMHVARFFGAGLARDDLDQRGIAFDQEIEGGVYGVEVVELVEALGAGAEFAGRLRAAEEKDTEQGDFVAMEIEDFVQAMLEFGDASIGGGGAGQAVLVEGVNGTADGVFVEGHDRIAIGFLIAGVEEGVEGEGIVFGRSDFLFDEGAQDAGFDFIQNDIHGDDFIKCSLQCWLLKCFWFG
jgi:hypothetical protein